MDYLTERHHVQACNTWSRLGLSTAASPALRHLLKSAEEPTDLGKFVMDKSRLRMAAEVKLQGHIEYLKKHGDTFLGYKWLLQALSRQQAGTSAGGAGVRIADVLLFQNGDPTEWLSTNRAGRVQAKRFDSTAAGEWDRFIKTARRAAGVQEDDASSPVCTRFIQGVEGVSGVQLSCSQMQLLARADSIHRFQVVGLQTLIGARCGQSGRPSNRKAIVYKAEYRKESVGGFAMRHTKEYDVHVIPWDTHMSSTRPRELQPFSTVASPPKWTDHQSSQEMSTSHTHAGAGDIMRGPAELQASANAGRKAADSAGNSPDNVTSSVGNHVAFLGMPNRMVAPPPTKVCDLREDLGSRATPSWLVKKQISANVGSSREALTDMTMQAIRYAERSRDLVLQRLKAHFVIDTGDNPALLTQTRITLFLSTL